MASPTKTYEGKYDTCDNNLPVPANSNNSRTRCHDTISVHSKHHIFVPQKQLLGDLKTYLAIEMSQNQYTNSWQITEVSDSTKRHAG